MDSILQTGSTSPRINEGRPRQRVQHLHGWQVFEAAARLKSFVRAAQELGVTPGAVSQHIKALEEHLGVRLFNRSTHGIQLTTEGVSVYPSLRDGFMMLSTAVRRLERRHFDRVVRVTAPPSFASRWLLGRIHRFSRRHPLFTPSLDATTSLADFAKDDVDVGIRYGTGKYEGLKSELLFEEHVFPVCSPALAQELGFEGQLSIDVLANLPLIHETGPAVTGVPSWSEWFAKHGASGPDMDGGLMLSSALAIQSAVEGQGVALGRSVIVADDLAAGRLVRICSESMKLQYAYYLVYRDESAVPDRVHAFCEWIRDEAEQSIQAAIFEA